MSEHQQAQSAIPRIAAVPPVWRRLREAAETSVTHEPELASHLHASILQHDALGPALSYHLAQQLSGSAMSALYLREIFESAQNQNEQLVVLASLDMQAVLERDPACHSLLQPFLFFKGYQALQTHRVAHHLWTSGRRNLAFLIQSRVSQLFNVDIHPAAQIGHSVMMDHASGIVIGETATIGDGCSLLHGVTLGGTGKDSGDRHPKVGRGVLISAGAKVLGNIRIGDEARIAAGSVVLEDVPDGCTYAGVPAKPVGKCSQPARTMDQRFEG